MNLFFRILLAFALALGAAGAEPQAPERVMDCPMSEGGTCPCGMPMPEKGPQPCGIALNAPVAPPVRRVTAVIESVTAADVIAREPLPWPDSWKVLSRLEDEKWRRSEPIPVDTGPPLLASERNAHLRVFLI